MELEDCNASECLCEDPSTSHRNLESFRPVTPEFWRLEYVQQASISIRVSFTTFAKERHSLRVYEMLRPVVNGENLR